MQKQHMDLITTLLQNQPPSPEAPVPSPAQTTSTPMEMQALIKAIVKEKPFPTLTFPMFTPNNRKNWCSTVKIKLKVCSRYSILHEDATGTLTEELANNHPEEYLSLNDRFLKTMYASTKPLFTVEDQLNGYRIFKSIEDSASNQKSDAELEFLCIEWMSIKRNSNKYIIAFAEQVQTDAAKFDSTEYEVKSKPLARR